MPSNELAHLKKCQHYTIPGLSLLLWRIFFLFFTATVFILRFICANNNTLVTEAFLSIAQLMVDDLILKDNCEYLYK